MTTLDATQVAAKLQAGPLMEEAARQAGLDDYGDTSFVEPFERFLSAIAAEGRLNELGLMAITADCTRFLVNRLRFVRDLKDHPEILDEDVEDPIVITGLPRTGTSKLQRMMSADPGVQRLLVWRLLNPAPFPDAGAGPDPRIAAAKAFEAMLDSFPDFQAAHPTRAEEVDEDLLLHEMTFESVVLTFRARMPSYLEWVRNRDTSQVYEYAKNQLRYLQWQDGGKRDRPWVLKTPAHLGSLDLLLAAFPNATVVHCHRAPTAVIPSFARAIQASRAITSDEVDPIEVGAEQLDIWSEAAARNLTLRDRLGARVVDLPYRMIRDEPEQAIAAVYETAVHPFTAEARAAMTAWTEENPQHRFGRNRYTAAEFGLEPDRIQAAFADYITRFAGLLDEK